MFLYGRVHFMVKLMWFLSRVDNINQNVIFLGGKLGYIAMYAVRISYGVKTSSLKRFWGNERGNDILLHKKNINCTADIV
jgi:hypothetical protein